MLILFLGLGAIYFFNQGVPGVINPADANLTAPLLADYIGGDAFYAIISSIAFATILGTVSGLIMASAGAIAHDIYTEVLGRKTDEKRSLLISKGTAIGVGLIAIVLGILAKGQNVAFLVGLAFAIAASANLPALLCTLFWKRTTERGIVYGIMRRRHPSSSFGLGTLTDTPGGPSRPGRGAVPRSSGPPHPAPEWGSARAR